MADDVRPTDGALQCEGSRHVRRPNDAPTCLCGTIEYQIDSGVSEAREILRVVGENRHGVQAAFRENRAGVASRLKALLGWP